MVHSEAALSVLSLDSTDDDALSVLQIRDISAKPIRDISSGVCVCVVKIHNPVIV